MRLGARAIRAVEIFLPCERIQHVDFPVTTSDGGLESQSYRELSVSFA